MAGLADSKDSIADTSIPDNEVAINVTGTESPNSASATITITMYGLADEMRR